MLRLVCAVQMAQEYMDLGMGGQEEGGGWAIGEGVVVGKERSVLYFFSLLAVSGEKQIFPFH